MTEFGPIIHVADLEQLGDTMVVCDVRWYLDGSSGYEAYLRGHIPGAVFVDLDSDLAGAPSTTDGRHPFPSAEVFATSLGVLGIGSDNTVVAYDDSGGLSASRMVWMLRMLGQPAALLDGGSGSKRSAGVTPSAEARSPINPIFASTWPFSNWDRNGAGLPTISPSSARVRPSRLRKNRSLWPNRSNSVVSAVIHAILAIQDK